ncbi:DUF4175 domain-containing protein [Paraglaciecola chathamensis]|uniref:DUF4175 domain-containing protein n=1 Tax=Paraglaciecola chathamensis TaxID=368405 RepID=A0ABS0WAE5_9ALTE|nr:DUF4175 domain-containing protein [Paraglaciecola chathamensis]MBJ2135307.1 DUF4175 domain-containing protein [Paraglaciecola chathamensis]
MANGFQRHTSPAPEPMALSQQAHNKAEQVRQIGALQQIVRTSKRRKLIQHMLYCLPVLLLLAAGLYLVDSAVFIWQPLVISTLFLVGLALCLLVAFYRPSYRAITPHNVAKDLNRRFPSLEESCQLVLVKDQHTLSVLQRLQYQRSAKALNKLLEDKNTPLAPRFGLKTALVLNLVTVLLCLFAANFICNIAHKPLADEVAISSAQETAHNVTNDALSKITNARVAVTPPNYAIGFNGFKRNQTQTLDMQVLAGSKVQWKLVFSNEPQGQNQPYSIQVNNTQLSLEHTSDGKHTASTVVKRAAVYQVLDHQRRVLAVHSIKVIPDESPQISFVAPQATITEIKSQNENRKPTISTQVVISDDFALSKVEILASVAKGSGESVKFRDSVFTFDTINTVDGQQLYSKEWNLSALGMEPGDELYFSVKAWDNRENQPQLTQSSTKVIRWLGEDIDTVFSEGTVIDNMPAYFKSQRQIIIDTKALIAQRLALTEHEFNHTSQELGVAQADLKHKYGQFVGDEVSGITRTMEDGASRQHNNEHDAEEAHEDHKNHEEHSEHEEPAEGSHDAHQHEDEHGLTEDKSGYQSVIEQFGHAHGETDVAIFKAPGGIEQNPRVMMKRAIAYMWQAEGQLRLNRPQDALPFEEQALIWLNRTKKAQRIYVKRLGFEPPPVSEQRRYQAELTDINTEAQHTPNVINDTDVRTLTKAIALLNAPLRVNAPFNAQEKELLSQTEVLLNSLLDETPEVIEALASLAQIQRSNRRTPNQCSSCVPRLTGQLWRLLPSPRYQVQQPAKLYSDTQPAIKQFAEFKQQQEAQ